MKGSTTDVLDVITLGLLERLRSAGAIAAPGKDRPQHIVCGMVDIYIYPTTIIVVYVYPSKGMPDVNILSYDDLDFDELVSFVKKAQGIKDDRPA